MKRSVSVLSAALCIGCSAAFAQENNILALPGQEAGSAGVAKKPEAPPAHVTPDSLKHPWIQFYYVEPTVVEGKETAVSYYVTDFDHSKVRFGDASRRFDVTLGLSPDGTNFTEQVQKGVPSGDGRFVLKGLKRGDYFVRLSCTDDKGIVSRTVWNDFRVRTDKELAITPAQTARPTLAELAKAGVVPDPDGFYRIEPVEVPDGVDFPVGIYRENFLKRKDQTEARNAINTAISNAVAAAVASEAGLALVKARPEGYVVFSPAKNGNYIYRTRDYRALAPGARHDAAATEARAKATSKGLTQYLAERAASGIRKVVLPKATWRISTEDILLVPSGMTLDLNGGKLKLNRTRATRSHAIQLFRTEDAHLVNGEIEGCYFEYDYENCGTRNPEHVGTFMMLGDARYCSLENIHVHDTVGGGTHFGITWLEDPFARPKFDVREWLGRNRLVGFAAEPPRKVRKGQPQPPTETWEKGLLDRQGIVKDGGEGCCTSPARTIGSLRKNRYFTVSRFLGYRGMSGVSDYFAIAFYDADGKFVHREIGFQYHRILIPARAETMRISLEVDSVEKANKSDLKAHITYHPQHCAFRNVRYTRCRTNGLGNYDGFNMLFDGIDISHSGDESCRCASDAEDGWDGMQNFTYRNVRCHDNPNGDFTVCCGHSFVYEKCDMRWWFWQRVHSPVIRDSAVRGATFDCLTRTRSGYTRFENNTYDLSKLTLGTADSVIRQKGVTPDWEIVLDGAAIKGKSKDDPATVSAHKTGRFRNCTFENCVQKGAKEHFGQP